MLWVHSFLCPWVSIFLFIRLFPRFLRISRSRLWFKPTRDFSRSLFSQGLRWTVGIRLLRNLLSALPRSSLLKSLRLASNLGVDFPSCLVRALGILGVDWKSETRLGLLAVSRSSSSFSSRYVGDLIFDTGVHGGYGPVSWVSRYKGFLRGGFLELISSSLRLPSRKPNQYLFFYFAFLSDPMWWFLPLCGLNAAG